MNLNRLLSVLLLAGTSSLWVSEVMAQTEPSSPEFIPVNPRTLGIDAPSEFAPVRLDTIPEAFDRAFFNDSGIFYKNRSFPRQLDVILGTGLPGRAAFPELEIERDAKLVNLLYRDALEQQVSSDPVLRTPDLPTPYNSSLLFESGATRFDGSVEGTEFFIPRLP